METMRSGFCRVVDVSVWLGWLKERFGGTELENMSIDNSGREEME